MTELWILPLVLAVAAEEVLPVLLRVGNLTQCQKVHRRITQRRTPRPHPQCLHTVSCLCHAQKHGKHLYFEQIKARNQSTA